MQVYAKRVINLLQANQLKITKQRLDIVDYLVANQHHYTPITAMTAHLQKIYPKMSYNTIYRNVQEFEQAGILEQHQKGSKATIKLQCDFEQEHHHHFICDKCGKVIELKRCPIDYFAIQIPDCEIQSHQFELSGLCGDCKKALQEEVLDYGQPTA